MTAHKHDDNKTRVELLPSDVLLEIASVLTLGARKYGDRNWEQGFNWNRIYGAAQRHLMSWHSGENIDEESGKSHLVHAACCIIFLIFFSLRNIGEDDRL